MKNKILNPDKYLWFSFIEQLLFRSLDRSNPFIRFFVFKLIFLSFGKNNKLDYGFFCRNPRRIRIGNNVEINQGCKFFASVRAPNGTITIDDDVVIAPFVTLLAAGQKKEGDRLFDTAAPIHIKSGTYIGAHVVIRYGVTIGKNSIIGAGTTVVSDVPDNSVIVSAKNRNL